MSTQNAMTIAFSRLLGRSLSAVAVATLIIFVAACSNSPSNMTTTQPPSFALSASSTSLSVQRGAQGSVTIAVVPANGFSGTVALTVSGLPTGVSGAFSLSSTTTTSNLTLTAAGTATLGSSTLTVTGTSSSLSATATIDLTIVSGSFTLSASSASLTVLQGAQGTDTITVVPSGGFSGMVALSASGLPNGVTASFNPASTTSSSTLTLSASSTAVTGTTSITISGTSSGLTASVNITLTVGGFSLSVLPTALTIQQGAVGNATVTVADSASAVTLSASGLPSGVTASFSPTSTTTQSTLTLTASSSATVGTSTVTISGKSGNVTQTTTLAVTVRSSAPNGGLPASFFALSNVDPTDDPTADGVSYGAVGHPDRLAWPYIEQSKGNYDFTLYDQYAATAPREGTGGVVAVMALTLGMTPGWAVANQTTCRTLPGSVIGCQAPPDNIQDWQNFIIALVNHYNGSTPSTPHIKYYEIWNEWNFQDAQNGFWMGTPVQLATLQSTACAIIHATPGIQYSFVLTPSTVGPAHNLNDKAAVELQTYFNSGGTNCPGSTNNNLIEGVSFHGIVADAGFSPYPLPGENCTQPGCNGAITDMTATYRQVLNLNSLQTTPLFDTEGGFETANITDIDQRAAWLAQFYALQAGLFTTNQLQWVSWFTWGYAPAPGLPGQIETANHQPDPAGVAYNQAFNWLYGRFPSQCTQSGSIWTCPLTGSSGYSAQIMWDDSQTCSNGTCSTTQQPAPSGATQWRDLAGAVHQISNGQVPVGLKPIIVEN